MPTVRLTKYGKVAAHNARSKKHWNQAERDFREAANTTKATLDRFWVGKNIDSITFVRILNRFTKLFY